MKLTNMLVAAMAVLLDLALGLAVPSNSHGDVVKRGHALANVYASGNLSSLFGWQVAGSGFIPAELWSGPCSKLSPRYKAIGLNPEYIKEPFCNSSYSALSSAEVVPYNDLYATNVFISHILSAFNSAAAYAHLCNVAGFNLIASFAIDDMTVIDAICIAGGQGLKPRPEANLPWASNSAVSAARNTASVLFAIIWSSAAASNSQLNASCARAADYVDNVNKEQLNGTVVQSTICQFTGPISTAQGREMVRTWLSRYFITVLENISNGDGYLEWLCENIDPKKLNHAGLNGYGIQSQICGDCKAEGHLPVDVSSIDPMAVEL